MWNPLSWVMEIAAIMAIALANGGGKPPDWEDFLGIVVLLVINSTISFVEENNAGNAAAALMAGLAPKTKVIRSDKSDSKFYFLIACLFSGDSRWAVGRAGRGDSGPR